MICHPITPSPTFGHYSIGIIEKPFEAVHLAQKITNMWDAYHLKTGLIADHV
jgi:hypothetical protein